MNDRVEKQILDILANETRALALSDQLFGAEGLFNQLAHSEQERRALVESALFRRAQARLSELQRHEAAQFAEAVHRARTDISGHDYRIKAERTEVA